IDAKWHGAAKKLEDAAGAFERAKRAQSEAIHAARANQELAAELVTGAFFAGLGGLAGGAIGNIINARMSKPTADPAFGGAITDGGKDTMKWATRALQKLGKGSQSGETTESPDPTLGGSEDSVGQDPVVWARSMSSKLHAEAAKALAALAQVQDR